MDNTRGPLSLSTTAQAVIVLTLFFLFVLSFGLHIDSLGVYWAAGEAFLSGADPYAFTAKFDALSQFKYSPLFALGMALLSQVQPMVFSISLWTLLGIAVFVSGLSKWMDKRSCAAPLMPIALLACFIDLGVCLWANQANALIIGLALIGMALYREHRFFAAGFVLVLATNLKVYPIIFLIGLSLLGNRSYWTGALVGGISSFALPALLVGWSVNWNVHLSWFQLLLHEVHSNGILDLHSAFQRAGLIQLGQSLPWIVGLVTLPLFLGVRMLDTNAWPAWITLGCSATLLLSPKAEVFTYALLAPCYVLMAVHCMASESKTLRVAGLACTLALSMLIVSNRFFSDTWMVSEDPLQILRVVGALGFWLLSALVLLQSYMQRWQPRP